MFEAEGKLILFLPHLCLYLQLSFSLGDMVRQFVGFGMGEAACWGSSPGCRAVVFNYYLGFEFVPCTVVKKRKFEMVYRK